MNAQFPSSAEGIDLQIISDEMEQMAFADLYYNPTRSILEAIQKGKEQERIPDPMIGSIG